MRASLAGFVENRAILVAILMSTYMAQSFLVTLSKRRGEYEYDPAAAVLFAELLKLVLAILMLTPKDRRGLSLGRSTLPYSFPALLYMTQNILVFEALRRLTPPEYQLLNNLKVFTTSIVFRVALRRSLRLVQWMALALLSLSMALSTWPGSAEANKPSAAEPGGESWSRWVGVGIMFAISWLSAGAGVTNEWLIKRSRNAIEANVWLYFYGSLVGLLHVYCSGGLARLWTLEGFTAIAWAVVFCNALLGQSIAFLLRYADSIVKLYAVSGAMCATTVVCVIFFDFEVNFQIVVGYLAFGLSLCFYYLPPETLVAQDDDLARKLCGGPVAPKHLEE